MMGRQDLTSSRFRLMHDALQTATAARPRLSDSFVKSFRESRLRTISPTTSEAPDLKSDSNPVAVCREIGQNPLIAAMDPRRYSAASRAQGGRRR
jgi:hypothetical protein